MPVQRYMLSLKTSAQSLQLCVQVRDAACAASGTLVRHFPAETRAQLIQLVPKWLKQLDDNVWSVREHAAVAIADAVRAFGQDVLTLIEPPLR